MLFLMLSFQFHFRIVQDCYWYQMQGWNCSGKLYWFLKSINLWVCFFWSRILMGFCLNVLLLIRVWRSLYNRKWCYRAQIDVLTPFIVTLAWWLSLPFSFSVFYLYCRSFLIEQQKQNLLVLSIEECSLQVMFLGF